MVFAILLAVALILGYLANKYYHSFWSKRGFEQVEPSFLVGSAGPLISGKTTMGVLFERVYKKHKDKKLMGIYMAYRPALTIHDPKLVQDILIRDFNSFHDRPMLVDPVNDPLQGHLFHLPGQKWRDLRVKLSPTFTSGKLKGMFSIIKDCGQVLEQYLKKNVSDGQNVFEFRDLMARFNTNIISSVAFGIENDCINEPDHIFRKMGDKILNPSFKDIFMGILAFSIPSLFKALKLKLTDSEVEEFIYSIVKQTIELREKKNFTRNDFMQLLIQLKTQGYVSVDKGEKESAEPENGNVRKLSLDEVAAQAFVFFIAGFETTSSTMSFALFEIARNPEIQKKCQQEIDRVFKSAGADGITYDMLSDLKYVECCIDETLRKYPIIPVIFRRAVKDYKIAGTDLIIPNGAEIFIPVLGFHRDPDIYDEPMKFKPERFLNSPHGGGKVEGLFYSPFGDGPRNCIGMRLGKLTTRIGLAIILSKYNLELSDKEMVDKELDFHPSQFVLTAMEPFNIKTSPRTA